MDASIRAGGVASRWAVGTVVVLIALLQCLGPFLHAHARSAQGGGGLHLHLTGAGQPTFATEAPHLQAAARPVATSDEGSAVFLTAEYRRDAELAPVLLASVALADRSPPPRADAGEGREVLRWPAAGGQAPPGLPPHRLPPATAPPPV